MKMVSFQNQNFEYLKLCNQRNHNTKNYVIYKMVFDFFIGISQKSSNEHSNDKMGSINICCQELKFTKIQNLSGKDFFALGDSVKFFKNSCKFFLSSEIQQAFKFIRTY